MFCQENHVIRLVRTSGWFFWEQIELYQSMYLQHVNQRKRKVNLLLIVDLKIQNKKYLQLILLKLTDIALLFLFSMLI